jgi:Peptidase family M23
VVLDPDSPSLTSWRGAGHGVVLVAVDGWGRARGAVMDVRAPCAGQVVLVTTDTRMGQAVVLDCAGTWVVLGQMQTITVAEGAQVATGVALGTAVALSLHAQMPGIAGHPFSGTPLAMVLDDRTAVRGMVLHGVVP